MCVLMFLGYYSMEIWEKMFSYFFWDLEYNKFNKSYDDSVKLKRTEMDPFRLGKV